jgi:hypothetical protein
VGRSCDWLDPGRRVWSVFSHCRNHGCCNVDTSLSGYVSHCFADLQSVHRKIYSRARPEIIVLHSVQRRRERRGQREGCNTNATQRDESGAVVISDASLPPKQQTTPGPPGDSGRRVKAITPVSCSLSSVRLPGRCGCGRRLRKPSSPCSAMLLCTRHMADFPMPNASWMC